MYALRYREEIKDPATVKELDDFISFLQHYLGVSLNEDGTLKLATPAGQGAFSSSQTGATSIMETIEDAEGHWWKKGPWIFDTDHSHEAILVTPQLSGTINDVAPAGIDTAVGIEFNLSADAIVTGIKAPPGTYRRVLILRNNSASHTLTLKHANAGSKPINQFALPADTDIVIGKHQTVWLYYDADNHRWGCFITANTSGGLAGAGSGASGGDVTGPGSSVDGDLVLFNGTTGKVVKDGGTTIASLIATAVAAGYMLQSTVILSEANILATSNTGVFPVTPTPSSGFILWPVAWSIEKVIRSPNNGGRAGGAGIIQLVHGAPTFLGFTLATDLNTDMSTGTRSRTDSTAGGARGYSNYGTRDPRGLPLAVSFSTATGAFSGSGVVTLQVSVIYYAMPVQNPGVTP